jgi:hypothetical protein
MHEAKKMKKQENLMLIIIYLKRRFWKHYVLIDILLDVLIETLMGYENINRQQITSTTFRSLKVFNCIASSLNNLSRNLW